MEQNIVDNFDEIRKHLKFNNRNEFYFIQIIQRRKDGNTGLRVRNGYRLIRSYYIYSLEDFDGLRDRIISLCISNNARAYLNPNVRNAQEVAMECIKKYADLVANNNAFMGNSIWDSCCGSTRAKGYRAKWIVDVDTKDRTVLDKVLSVIHSCKHADDFEAYVVNTVNGFHIVSNGFDSREFQKILSDNGIDKVDIHKNNPTLLYYDISGQQKQNSI